MDEATGAASSLNKTITELMDFLTDGRPRPSPYDRGLRDFCHELIAELAQRAYKQGYHKAHLDCWRAYNKSGKQFPKLIQTDGRPRLAPFKNSFFWSDSKVS